MYGFIARLLTSALAFGGNSARLLEARGLAGRHARDRARAWRTLNKVLPPQIFVIEGVVDNVEQVTATKWLAAYQVISLGRSRVALPLRAPAKRGTRVQVLEDGRAKIENKYYILPTRNTAGVEWIILAVQLFGWLVLCAAATFSIAAALMYALTGMELILVPSIVPLTLRPSLADSLSVDILRTIYTW